MDHAALLVKYYLIQSLTMQPPPMPKGYHANEDKKAEWCKAFSNQMLLVKTYTTIQHLSMPQQPLHEVESEHLDHDALC